MDRNYEDKIQADVNAIFTLMEQRVDEKQMLLIHSAYELAKFAHKDQRRKSGEPYISHPVAVARIVAEEMELGANPVMAAFLHDVIEDCPYTIDEIRERFGDDVEIIDSYFEDYDPKNGCIPLKYLSKSLELLADADVAYFCPGWDTARGCKIENQCAVEYGIERIYA